ncbi:MAG: NAD(P)H-hydrate dehydratase, partial [Planctomycetes bacterium]|nr:NAD(P)H-hydrate dehydratase [Planctomycetota bacterium]
AARRSGVGLVQIVIFREAMAHVLGLAPCATAVALPEPGGPTLTELVVGYGTDVVAIGPGLDPAIDAARVAELLASFSGCLVIDADGLNRLATLGRWTARWPHQVVLTPHPGEMQRLLAGRSIEVDAADRQACAVALSQATGTVVAHKGAHTVVTDGRRVFVNQTGNSGMATAGSGDVLTGVIAALLGQKMSAFDAAVLGVYVHGLAGDIAAEELGRLSLTALDLVDYLADAYCELDPAYQE